MGNFGDLQRKKEADEEKARRDALQRQEAQRRLEQAKSDAQERKIAVLDDQHDRVVELLEELRDIYYPEYLVRRWDDEHTNETRWIIKEPSDRSNYGVMQVEIEFNDKGQAKHYKTSNQGRSHSSSGFSDFELKRTLKKLFNEHHRDWKDEVETVMLAFQMVLLFLFYIIGGAFSIHPVAGLISLFIGIWIIATIPTNIFALFLFLIAWFIAYLMARSEK